MSSRADGVHIVVLMMKRGGEQFHGNVHFAFSSLDVQTTVRRKLPAKAIHWCCTYRRVNDDNWGQTYSRECRDRLVSLMKIYLPRRLPANLFTAAVHSCLWWKLVRSAPTDSRNENWCSKRWFPEITDRRSETEREKNPSLSSALRNSLSAMSPLRCSLALSQREISRETSGTRIAVNHFADDLKCIEQVVHTDG